MSEDSDVSRRQLLVEFPWAFNGQYTDTETGLIYLRARYYDPATAAFLTRDPLAAQTRRPYGYAGDNPLTYTDPLGLCWGPDSVCHLVGAAADLAVDHKKEIGIGLAIVAAGTGVGAIAEGGFALAAVSLGTGLGAAAIDGRMCAQGDKVACVGAGLGSVSAVAAAFPVAGAYALGAGIIEAGSLADALLNGVAGGLAFGSGSAAAGFDAAALFFPGEASEAELCEP